MNVGHDCMLQSSSWKKSLWIHRLCSLFRTACTLSLIGAFCQPAHALAVPGVGFGLDPDHGTAAIYFANGSFAPVARVEGSPSYKAFMRSVSSRQHTQRIAFCRTLLTYASRLVPFCAPSPDAESVEALLLDLKAAVSSYLSTSFCYADIALSHPYDHGSYQRNVIEEPLQYIGLRQARGSGTFRVLTASSAAIQTNKIASLPPDENPQVVLVIGYSQSLVDAALVCEEFGVIDRLRHDHAVYDNETDGAGQLQMVADVLRRASEPPLGACAFKTAPEEVHTLLLHGDSVGDSGFLEVLTEIFGADRVENGYVISPVYSAAIGVAMSSHEHVHDVGFREPAALGCRWRSGLYWGSHGDL